MSGDSTPSAGTSHGKPASDDISNPQETSPGEEWPPALIRVCEWGSDRRLLYIRFLGRIQSRDFLNWHSGRGDPQEVAGDLYSATNTQARADYR